MTFPDGIDATAGMVGIAREGAGPGVPEAPAVSVATELAEEVVWLGLDEAGA
jgi:hypothetical protein